MPAELLNARPAPTLCIGQRVIKLEMVSKNNKHQKKKNYKNYSTFHIAWNSTCKAEENIKEMK